MSTGTEGVEAEVVLSWDDEGRPVVEAGGRRAASPAELAALAGAGAAAPAEALGSYCLGVNHLARGAEFRVILDPDAYRARYEARYAAEDPDAPFQQGVPRLRDFGHADLARVQPPRLDGRSVVFFAEDDFLGIPYRVTAPSPGPEGAPAQEVVYEPVPVAP